MKLHYFILKLGTKYNALRTDEKFPTKTTNKKDNKGNLVSDCQLNPLNYRWQ